jgi:hypothetical protein
MQIRRPLAALMTALALFGGGATLTACGDPAGADRNDGTADDAGHSGTEGSDDTSRENTEENGNLPNNSDPQHDSEDVNDDTQDPD